MAVENLIRMPIYILEIVRYHDFDHGATMAPEISSKRICLLVLGAGFASKTSTLAVDAVAIPSDTPQQAEAQSDGQGPKATSSIHNTCPTIPGKHLKYVSNDSLVCGCGGSFTERSVISKSPILDVAPLSDVKS